MFDIRTIPVAYINLDICYEREEYMTNLLKSNGFLNYRRISAVYKPNAPHVGCFISHVKAIAELFDTCTDEYVLVLEDDVLFNDIQLINETIAKTIDDRPFDLFTITYPDRFNGITIDELNTVSRPPRKNTNQGHFLLFRRKAIPTILNDFTQTMRTHGVFDRYSHYGDNVVTFNSFACCQLVNYFISNTSGNRYTHVFCSDVPYTKTFDELVRSFPNKDGYDVFRYYYVQDGCLKENSPFSMNSNTDITFSNNKVDLIYNIVSYLKTKRANNIIIWNDTADHGLSVNDALVKI